MKRLLAGAVTAAGFVLLAGCGDTGDHFLDFQRTQSSVSSVARVALALPIVPSTSVAGVYQLTVTAYGDTGAPITQGTFTHPIVITGTCGILFSADGQNYTISSYQVTTPTQVVSFARPGNNQACTITATDQDAAQATSIFV